MELQSISFISKRLSHQTVSIVYMDDGLLIAKFYPAIVIFFIERIHK